MTETAVVTLGHHLVAGPLWNITLIATRKKESHRAANPSASCIHVQELVNALCSFPPHAPMSKYSPMPCAPPNPP